MDRSVSGLAPNGERLSFGSAVEPAIADAARLGDLLPVSDGPSVALDPQLMIVEDATIVDTAAVSQLVR